MVTRLAPDDTLRAIVNDLADGQRDIDGLTHDQRVPLVEKIRLQRLHRTLAEVRTELLQMEGRAMRSGWQVTQEGSSRGDAVASSGPAPGNESADQ